MTQETGVIMRSHPLHGGRIELPTVHTTTTALRAAAQSFAYGDPGDIVEWYLAGESGAYQFVKTGPVCDGRQQGRYVEYNARAEVVNTNAPAVRAPINRCSFDGYAHGM